MQGLPSLAGLLALCSLSLAGWAVAAAAADLSAGAGARIAQAASLDGGDLSLEAAQDGAPTAAGSFLLSGPPNTAVSFNFAADPPLAGFTHDAGPTPATGPDGRLTVRVGAALVPPPDESGGAYAGVYRVIVNY